MVELNSGVEWFRREVLTRNDQRRKKSARKKRNIKEGKGKIRKRKKRRFLRLLRFNKYKHQYYSGYLRYSYKEK